MDQPVSDIDQRGNPWIQGLIAMGIVAILIGVLLIIYVVPGADVPIAWALVGTTLIAVGGTAWIGAGIVAALLWQPDVRLWRANARQATPWMPQFAGWFPDPDGRGERYFDGAAWTEQTR